MSRELVTARLSSKGQITLPKRIRDYLNVSEGDNLTFIVGDDSITIMKASDFLKKLDKLHEIIKDEIGDKVYTDEEIQEWVNEVRYGKKK